ncbi:MAG: methyltransferase domain-containing protein [Bacillota bacterium]|nr:methyltransferase domain-containing protein [Bacillota bacterium]
MDIERVVPKQMKPDNRLLIEHISRYKFAAKYSFGRILDIACGVGYGMKIIKEHSVRPIAEMVGVDLDGDSIRYAIDHYWEKGMDYYEGDALDHSLKQKIGTFDTIVSMETIEHLQDDFRFIKIMKSLLNPGGIAIISTPFGQGRGKPCGNPFHLHQYLEEEFIELVQPLGKLEMYYQLDDQIEKRKLGKKYYLMIAVCQNS